MDTAASFSGLAVYARLQCKLWDDMEISKMLSASLATMHQQYPAIHLFFSHQREAGAVIILVPEWDNCVDEKQLNKPSLTETDVMLLDSRNAPGPGNISDLALGGGRELEDYPPVIQVIDSYDCRFGLLHNLGEDCQQCPSFCSWYLISLHWNKINEIEPLFVHFLFLSG